MKWWRHPTCVSLTITMQISCFVYIVTLPGEHPVVLLRSQWPQCLHKIMYLYSICLVSTTCCDATITQHKRNTNIHKLCTLPNTLLAIVIICSTLQSPENGRVIQFDNAPGSVASYRCNEGYKLQSGVSSSRTCGSDGQWSGVAPVCEGKSYSITLTSGSHS